MLNNTIYYEVYKIIHSTENNTNDIDYKGSCEAIAFNTLEEAIDFAEKNNITLISKIGGNFADYEKCAFCGEWYDSSDLNQYGDCWRCEQAIKDHNGCYNYEPNFDYDTPEEIEKCLNCQKPDCDNCLKSINGV